MKQLTLNRVFGVYLVVFVAIVGGFVPREIALYATAFLCVWALLVPLEDAMLFFVRSVPLFIALPLTATYDNLNMWRPLAVVLFARLLLQWQTWQELKELLNFREHPVFRRLTVLFALAGLSLIGAMYPLTGVIRIIYFANLLMIPVVLYLLVRRGTLTARRVIENIAIPTVIVIVVGYLQLASTYLLDVYQFMHVWGEGFQLRQFGSQWSYIAVNVGNTWLAYYGSQLSLRVFSLFTDSHTFPMFVLMGIPALFALVRGRSRWAKLWIPAALLIVILSGTRGIWAAGVGTALIAGILWWRTKQPVFASLSRWMAYFFLLFIVAWPIVISPQFLLSTGGDLRNRIRSIIDFGETSNAQRLKIWSSSLVSIAHHPILGVGIGNFPVVLGQDIRLARAGSTAHNVYLHVAAEMGIPAALEFVILLGGILTVTWRWFRTAQGRELVYAAAALLYLPWILIYLLTDAALFDERVFLMFGIAAALILAHD